MKRLLISQEDYSKMNPSFSESLKFAVAFDKKMDALMAPRAFRIEITKEGNAKYMFDDKTFNSLVEEIFKEGE